MNEDKEMTVNNVYDYSNAIVTEEEIAYLVQYLDHTYNQLVELINEDEKRNEKLKYELQNYTYKESFGKALSITVYNKNYSNVTCNNYASFMELINNKQLRNVGHINIQMDLNYRRGNNNNLVSHNNSFKIVFKPYDISFVRQSNFQEEEMDQIENYINQVLKSFPVANTIFCYKDNN